MSKETEPIRSRRQLREQLAKSAGAAEKPSAPVSPASTKAASGADPKTASEAKPELDSTTENRPAAKVDAAPAAKPAPTAKVDAAPDAKPEPAAKPAPAAKPEPSGTTDAAPKERQSQTRARDRAALRAYKELLDQPNTAPLPSRRALRQAQLDADRAPVTAVNPVVSPPLKPAGAPPVRQPAAAEKTTAAKQDAPSQSKGQGSPAEGQTKAAGAAPSSGAVSGVRTRAGRRAAAPEASAAEATSSVDPLTQAPLSADQADAAQAQALAAIKEAAAAAAARVNGASEDKLPPATEAGYPPLPGLVPGGDYYPVSAGPPPAVPTPSAEELQLLAAERAEKERAAVLAERAQARDRLAQESAKNRRAADPTATNNLAMVTPLEFIEVEGSESPVLRQPGTTHVPIVTRATPRQTPSRRIPPRPEPKPQSRAAGPAEAPPASDAKVRNQGAATAGAERFDAALAPRTVRRPGTGERPSTGGHSNTLKRAEAMAADGQQTVPPVAAPDAVTRSQMPPMPADYAHGLEPLDAVTAGLGRTQRNLLWLWGSVIVGGAAVIACLIMIFTYL